jgi:hypothetical protein
MLNILDILKENGGRVKDKKELHVEIIICYGRKDRALHHRV